MLNRLIAALHCENVEIYVHLDLKSDIDVSEIDQRAHLIENRVSVFWGEFSMVQATINSITEINEKETDYSHICFISGQDYPIQSNAKIQSTILSDTDYLTYTHLTYSGNWRAARWDTRYDVGLSKFINKYNISGVVKKIFRHVLKLYKKTKRHQGEPRYGKLYGGSQWWILSHKSIIYVLNFLKKRKSIICDFKNVGCADELFFQTILCNAPFADKIVNNNHHYYDWTNCYNNPNIINGPNTLVVEDYEKIIASNQLFCRKVSLPESERLIELLDLYRQ